MIPKSDEVVYEIPVISNQNLNRKGEVSSECDFNSIWTKFWTKCNIIISQGHIERTFKKRNER